MQKEPEKAKPAGLGAAEDESKGHLSAQPGAEGTEAGAPAAAGGSLGLRALGSLEVVGPKGSTHRVTGVRRRREDGAIMQPGWSEQEEQEEELGSERAGTAWPGQRASEARDTAGSRRSGDHRGGSQPGPESPSQPPAGLPWGWAADP